MRTPTLKLVTLAVALLGAAGAAQADEWRYAIQPYLWLPTINSTLSFTPPDGGGAPESQTGPNDYLSNLKMLMMLNGEARNGDWAIISDFVYLSFKGERSHVKGIDFNIGGSRNPVSSAVDTGSTTSFSGAEWSLAASRVVGRGPGSTLEALGGVRYFGLKATADWSLNASVTGPNGTRSFPANGSISERVDLWNAILGARGNINFGPNWFMQYYFDLGFGGDSQSKQGMLGGGYRFSWGEASLLYRHIVYEQSSDKLVQKLSFSGPAVGVNFRF